MGAANIRIIPLDYASKQWLTKVQSGCARRGYTRCAWKCRGFLQCVVYFEVWSKKAGPVVYTDFQSAYWSLRKKRFADLGSTGGEDRSAVAAKDTKKL